MSTRAQVIVRDEHSELWFYRHSDGYPEGVKDTLDKFCRWVNEGRIRNNAEQSAGWLVVIGRDEYREWENKGWRLASQHGPFEPGYDSSCYGWNVGAYEPCAPIRHGDIEHLYLITLGGRDIDASWKEIPIVE